MAYKAWLKSVLAVKPGERHPDLGKYRKQLAGCASGLDECPLCLYPLEEYEHDPCMKNLPGVKNACCGHGEQVAYATLESNFCLRGKALKTYLMKVERLPVVSKWWRWRRNEEERLDEEAEEAFLAAMASGAGNKKAHLAADAVRIKARRSKKR